MATADIDLEQLPFFPEYEIEYEGGPDSLARFNQCKKNPGHPNFIPVNEFTIDHIPQEYRTDKVMEDIKQVCDRTVRIVVKYVSLNRPNKNYTNCNIRGEEYSTFGTGYVLGGSKRNVERIENERCPCRLCKTCYDPKMGYLKVEVITNKHIVFDDSEAERSTVEFGYDSADRSEVITWYGVSVRHDSIDWDRSSVTCVNHDMELYQQFHQKCTFDTTTKSPIMISHPHGVSKRITVGTFINQVIKAMIPKDQPFTFKVGPGQKCRLSKHHPDTSLESFGQLVDCGTHCQPGVVYRVREGVEMSCNPSTCWVYQDFIYILRKYSDNEDRDFLKFIKFPSDVEFTFANGNPSKSFPDVEFEPDWEDHCFLAQAKVETHWEYDMDTCVGSSGAMGSGWWGGWVPHAGYNTTNCVNRTGRAMWPSKYGDDDEDDGCCSAILAALTNVRGLLLGYEPL